MFVENMAVVFVVSNILFLIYEFWKNKKFDKYLVLNLIVSIAGTILMILSPGSKLRANDTLEFVNLNIIEKIIFNIPNFVYYTFIRNNWMLLMLVVVLSVLVYQKEKQKNFKIFYILFLISLPLLELVAYAIKIVNKVIPIEMLYKIASAILDPTRERHYNIFYFVYNFMFISNI